MDTPVILSHRTAWLLHHAPRRKQAVEQARQQDIFEPDLKACGIAVRLRTFLLACGIDESELDRIDTLVYFSHDRQRTPAIRSHVLGRIPDSRHLLGVAKGLLVVDEELCYLQAATWMVPLELVEYGFEVCGNYETRLGENYVELPARTSKAELASTIAELPRVRGAKRARQALSLVRDRSRSPMETALALAIMLPAESGGLGYKDIEMNRSVPIPGNMRRLCPSDHLDVDIYAPSVGAGVEYDGSAHAELERRTRDADRASVLGAMGIPSRTITAGHFASQLGFHRALLGVARLLGVEGRTDAEFQRRQNDLRMWLIRSWDSSRT